MSLTPSDSSRPAGPSRRALLGGAAAATLALAATAAGAGAATAHPRADRPARPGRASWPTDFPLPDGFRPEGIAIGNGPYAYMGSLADGSIRRADLRTGEGRTVLAGATGGAATGLKLDRDGLLYISGGVSGSIRVFDTRRNRLTATYQPTTVGFVNDVILYGDRAWFTNSNAPVLYNVPRGGRRRGKDDLRSVPLGGEWEQAPTGISANGIETTPDGRALIVVNSPTGKLFRVDPKTGHATNITLKGAPDVVNGDGLLRVGDLLYVVQNRLNLVTVFQLDADARKATLRRSILDPRFDVPTTAARLGNRLYLVNARFTTTPTPETTYNAVAVPLR
ncbi:superoxide dismutase [Streptomyces sp. NBC_01716]|uniref:superoxide dismutase n=1 Tax=Streptomyces sp. NBC_01716 TaxID=2975917 RepID=UPI002E32F1BF|nr:superoxide dismutase [Streptomyces sp. NBC_01716]